MSAGADLERYVRHLAARRVPVPGIVRLTGLPRMPSRRSCAVRRGGTSPLHERSETCLT